MGGQIDSHLNPEAIAVVTEIGLQKEVVQRLFGRIPISGEVSNQLDIERVFVFKPFGDASLQSAGGELSDLPLHQKCSAARPGR